MRTRLKESDVPEAEAVVIRATLEEHDRRLREEVLRPIGKTVGEIVVGVQNAVRAVQAAHANYVSAGRAFPEFASASALFPGLASIARQIAQAAQAAQAAQVQANAIAVRRNAGRHRRPQRAIRPAAGRHQRAPRRQRPAARRVVRRASARGDPPGPEPQRYHTAHARPRGPPRDAMA